MKYRVLIGMEVHLQLRTKSKMFCRCPVRFGAPPNTLTCPVCLGMPGALPVPNRDAMIRAIALARALDCDIATDTKFDRKNYFYPDLPKGYQISQFDRPLATGGCVEIVTEEGIKRIRLRRIHIEEDVGKNIHEDGSKLSRVDFNRAGTPLVEIVSEPDIASPEEAHKYLDALRAVVRYLDISDANMQEGNLRCEPNVNIHIETEDGVVKTPIVEVKNLNSMRNVERAAICEIARHQELYRELGAKVADLPRSTCGFDDQTDKTFVMRQKEEAHDYRYFPEPDIPPIQIGSAWLGTANDMVPELPRAKRQRFADDYGLSAYDAENLCRERSTADYFETVVKAGAAAKPTANWLLGDVSFHAKERQVAIAALGLAASRLASMVNLVEEGKVSRKAAEKDLLPRMIAEGADPAQLVTDLGLAQVDDSSVLEEAARQAIAQNPKAAADFRAGKEKALNALKGLVMRETRGKANPTVVESVLRNILETE